MYKMSSLVTYCIDLCKLFTSQTVCVNSGSCGIVVVDCVMHGRELRVTTLERACTVGPEQLSPPSAAGCLPCVLGERR